VRLNEPARERQDRDLQKVSQRGQAHPLQKDKGDSYATVGMADGWRRDESKEKRDPSATVGMTDGGRRENETYRTVLGSAWYSPKSFIKGDDRHVDVAFAFGNGVLRLKLSALGV